MTHGWLDHNSRDSWDAKEILPRHHEVTLDDVELMVCDVGSYWHWFVMWEVIGIGL